ncbi:MAG: hypothetical protein H6656_00900 [Ardenticatenaceae bacterium]|nr:hypothetical protein [Anaerolineales bacterium]MCB9005943.1 hypothetical protein [Ardenticatenaceae bacterium]
MIDTDIKLDIQQELSEIPPEYQDAFRRAIGQELAETEQNRTDTDILAYLRRRRDDFKQGSFIRPDGRPGMVALSPEMMYEQALPQLVQSSLGEPDRTTERRRTLIKLGVFAGLAVLLFIVALRGRAQRAAGDELSVTGTPVASVADGGRATPTPPLPEITGVDDSLQTIGNLGGALTIGRPSAIEIRYGRTEETIALAIDPSKPTPKGEMRYNEAAMLSDNPVAVWLFGTVLNYALGLPDSLVRNLEPGDRITLSTDTGASLSFIVAETGQGANYDAGRLLSQNRLGLTLFALPAVAEGDVAYVFAHYDVAAEEGQEQSVYAVGDSAAFGTAGQLQITAVQFDHTGDRLFRIVVSGVIEGLSSSHSILLSLNAGGEQTTAVPLGLTDTGEWQAEFFLPLATAKRDLLAEFRLLPDGQLVGVQLGEIPDLTEQLAVEITGAQWDEAQERAVLTVSIHNRVHAGHPNGRAGAVYLDLDFIQISDNERTSEGGDAYVGTGQLNPGLPLLINPGETMAITLSFLPQSASVRLQIGAGLWEIAGFPAR